MNKDNEVFKYQIDENNKIIYVSDNWEKFAKENNADENILPSNVIGKSIFDFISDRESKTIYEMIINSIRLKKTDVKIPINCDSPNLRRFIEITIKGLPNNHIEFASEIQHIVERESCEILDENTERCEEAIRICSFCKKIPIENEWLDAECAVSVLKVFRNSKMPMLTHSICPKCYEVAMNQLK